MRLLLIGLLCALTACASLAPKPAPAPTPTSWPRVRLPSPGYGFEAYLWWKEEVASRDLGLIREAGFEWVKQTFAWRDIEIEQGKYDWSRTDRIVSQVEDYTRKLIVRIDREPYWDMRYTYDGSIASGPPKDLNHFFDFCGKLAARYKSRVVAYQVWNEPNLAREWGNAAPNPTEYVAMLKGCYSAIKTADPKALVMSAGLSPTGNGLPAAMPDADFLRGMYEAGAAPYFDLLGAHAPGFKAAPETSPDAVAQDAALGGQRFFCFRRVEDLRAIMLQFGDGEKQVAILEFGWTTDPIHKDYAWFAVSEQTKADYMVRAFQFAKKNWSPWIGPMIALSIPQFDWTPDNEQYWWAVLGPDYPFPKYLPAFDALKAMAK
jgi:polysaccharide biosynthesis protein PslG